MTYLCILFIPPLYFLSRKKWGGFLVSSILCGLALLCIFTIVAIAIAPIFWLLSVGHAAFANRNERADRHADRIATKLAETMRQNTPPRIIDPTTAQVLMRVKNNVTTYYVHGSGLLYEVTENGANTNLLTYDYDYRGSTVALSDSNGIPKDRIEYSAYGLTTYRSGTNDTPFLFNGRHGVQTDANGLLYMRARYYNPYLCRFMNADPSGFAGGQNFFAYANCNPVSLIDQFGLGAEAKERSACRLRKSGPRSNR